MILVETHPDIGIGPPESKINIALPLPIKNPTTKRTYKDMLRKFPKKYMKQKKIVNQLREWLKEEFRVQKLKV